MRYGMLGLYSAIMQALGIAVAILSFFGGVVVIAFMLTSLTRIAPLSILMAIAGMVGGCFVGLAYAAIGQLVALAIDVEHNTRMAVSRRQWGELLDD